MTHTEIVTSPLTQRNTAYIVKEFAVQNIIEDWKKTFGIDISKEFQGCDKLQLCQCEDTGLQFFLPNTVAGSEDMYAQLQKFDWYYMYEKWEHQVAIKDLKGCQNILEIGSGSGDFIRLAKESGLHVRGIELNEAAVAAAASKGLPVERLDLEDAAKLYSGTFDAVCSFQVLEHVSNPKEFIEYSVRLLKPGGLLIYCVPNPESFLKYLDNLLDMPPHHMTQWSVGTFQALEKFYPLRLFCVKYEPLAHYHVDAYVNAHQKHLLAISSIYRLLLNRFTMPVICFALRLGLRRFCRGQSIYVELVKL